MDGTAANFYYFKFPHEAGTWEPNYTPGVDFWTKIFLFSKNSGQDPMRGQTFFLSSLKVGH